jgi:methylmalonyl-CoA/ethylmalonyl-CoA epimerase
MMRLHHVGQAVRAIDAAGLMERFGYVIESPVFHDPAQTALVQFLRLPGETCYLELVAPDGARSKLAGAVRRGGGLHHLCYSAGRLEPEIERLETAGLKLVSEPKAAVAFAGRRICWLMGTDQVLVELVERRNDADLCTPVTDLAYRTG